VVRDAVRIAIQMHVETVERVASGVGQAIEELTLWTVRRAAQDVVAAPAEHNLCIWIDGFDAAIHGLELADVIVGGASPQRAVARFVVALPVGDAPGAA